MELEECMVGITPGWVGWGRRLSVDRVSVVPDWSDVARSLGRWSLAWIGLGIDVWRDSKLEGAWEFLVLIGGVLSLN